jgi:hypothetical protein
MATEIFVGPVTLKPDTKGKDVEEFYVNEFVPNLTPLSGYKFTLNKGSQGKRDGQYILLGHFESVERAKELFPIAGDPRGSKEMQNWQDSNPVWNQLLDFFDMPDMLVNYTDYIEVS